MGSNNINDYTNTSDMLQHLKKVYPNTLPKESLDEVKLSRLQGQQDVISSIKEALIIQEQRNKEL